MKKILYKIYRVLFWVLPLFIIIIILNKIDYEKFALNISKANPWMIFLGLGYYPLVVLIGATRWHLLLTQYHKTKIRLLFSFKHYWIGLALGFFVPASIGWDSYRIIVSGRQYGAYTLNTGVIMVEKLMALITCMSLIIFLYPIVPITSDPFLQKIVYFAYIILSISIFFIIFIFYIEKNLRLYKLLEKLELFICKAINKILSKMEIKIDEKNGLTFQSLFKPITVPKQVMTILIISFGIQFVSAIGNQIFFMALGYDLPFIVNLFVLPILFFIFLLPISFGSLGIREGAYIILYGLFGVPAETALIVSFFNLTGILLNNLIGGVLMVVSNYKVMSAS
jgi:uncharacterized protein (TIRG00374 family)